MLVLTRKPGESIKIGNDVTLTVIAVHGNRVQVGITAPSEVPVHREEVLHKLKAHCFAPCDEQDEAC